ncbi:MAG: MBL fold metallo-hydrolase [bacterium]
MELRELGNDVFACLQPDRGLGWSNSGLINRGGGVVVDTFWDLPRTRQLIAEYARVWRQPATRVVNTHHNGDHCWGNQLFPGAELIGHRLCAAAFGKEKPEAMQALRSMVDAPDPAVANLARELAPYDFSGIQLTPPTTLFDERLDLDVDGMRVELIYVGPAHTAGDTIVYLPEQRIVFTGDVLFRLCTPIGWEGTYNGWINALDRIAALDPAVVVPGHGPLCGVEGLREMQAYLRYIRSESAVHFAAGRTVEEASMRIDLGPYASWTEPERIVFNVARAYRELRSEAWDTPVDVSWVLHSMFTLRGKLNRG